MLIAITAFILVVSIAVMAGMELADKKRTENQRPPTRTNVPFLS
jgi:hypothetical protein